MLRLKNILIISIFSFFLVQPSHAQSFLKKLSDRAMKKANSETQNSKNREQKKKGFNLQGLMKDMGIASTPVPIEDNYYFDHLIQMHMESFDRNGKKVSDGDFITHFDPKSKSMAYQVVSGDMAKQGKALFIIDTKNKATIMLSEENGEKKGIVYGMEGYFESIGEDIDQEEDVDMSETPEAYMANPNVTKTGRTKNIAGYKCEEYIYKDEDGKSDIWITKDLKLNSRDFLSTLFKTSMATNGMGWGYVMEATSTDNSGEKSIMEVTRVDSNSNVSFSLDNYDITNLGTMTVPEEDDGEK